MAPRTAGDDSLNGSSSNDVLFGDLGNDYQRGGDGSDTYVYRSGDGNDDIDDQSGSVVDIDTLKFVDLNAADITMSRSGDAILVGINTTGQTVKIDNQFYSPTANWGVESFSSPMAPSGTSPT